MDIAELKIHLRVSTFLRLVFIDNRKKRFLPIVCYPFPLSVNGFLRLWSLPSKPYFSKEGIEIYLFLDFRSVLFAFVGLLPYDLFIIEAVLSRRRMALYSVFSIFEF